MTQPHEIVARATVMNGWGEILERQTLPGLANVDDGVWFLCGCSFEKQSVGQNLLTSAN